MSSNNWCSCIARFVTFVISGVFILRRYQLSTGSRTRRLCWRTKSIIPSLLQQLANHRPHNPPKFPKKSKKNYLLKSPKILLNLWKILPLCRMPRLWSHCTYRTTRRSRLAVHPILSYERMGLILIELCNSATPDGASIPFFLDLAVRWCGVVGKAPGFAIFDIISISLQHAKITGIVPTGHDSVCCLM